MSSEINIAMHLEYIRSTKIQASNRKTDFYHETTKERNHEKGPGKFRVLLVSCFRDYSFNFKRANFIVMEKIQK